MATSVLEDEMADKVGVLHEREKCAYVIVIVFECLIFAAVAPT